MNFKNIKYKMIILCGGRGKRMGKITNKIPKPLIQVAKKPIIEHKLIYYKSQGLTDFIFCLGYKSNQLRKFLKNKLPILLLPGNPVASFVTFNIFAKFLINCMLGNKKFNLRFYKVKANLSMKKKVGREEYIRGKIFTKNNIIYVDKFHTEGAGILSSVVWSTGLIRLDSKTEYIKKNDNLDFLPYESFL